MGVRRRGARRGSGKGNAGDEAGASEAVQQPTRGSARAASGLKPSEEEILAAIETLYDDGLKPFGRILRKRLAERAAPAAALEELEQPRQERGKAKGGSSLPDIDVKHLQSVCEASERLTIRPEEGGDWSAVFSDRPEEFVDIYSAIDPYSDEFWAAASEHFGSLPKDAMQLPGGRYSCAQMLMRRDLPFLADFSLGKVCHFVQLAISTRKVLGYADGSVVPYAHSQSMVKEQCALGQQPCAGPGGGTGEEGGTIMPFATWDEARRCLKEILSEAAEPEQGPTMVPLSNVKRLFRSRFSVELSETYLGHSKLSDLLQDHRFKEICSVQLQGQGYIVVQNTEPQTEETAQISLDEAVPQEPKHVSTLGLAELLAAELSTPWEPLEEPPSRVNLFNCGELGGLDEAAYEDPWQAAVTGAASTPLQSPGVPPSCTVRRWAGEVAPPPAAQFLSATGQPLVLEGLDLCAAGLESYMAYEQEDEAEQQRPRRVEFCPDAPAIFDEDTFGQLTTPLPSPGVPTSTIVRRWPQGAVAHICPSGAMPYGGTGPAASSAAVAQSREESLATPPSAPARSPAVRWQVQNTFIHAAGPPATPIPGARQRSHSLPKDMGTSRSSAVEAEADVASAALGVVPLGARLCDSAAESTADNGSAASGSAIGLQPPASPAPSSTGTPERLAAVLSSATLESTPVKVPLERLESLGCLSDDGLRTPSQRRPKLLCPELEDNGGVFVDATPQSRRAPCTTPSRGGRDNGWVVQNTFIHAQAAPPTPAPGARLRARSLPKDAGSVIRPCPTPLAPAPQQQPLAKRATTGEGIDVAPAFVPPPSPALVPPTPQSPLYSGGAGAYMWPGQALASKARPRASPVAEDQRVLRLSDYL